MNLVTKIIIASWLIALSILVFGQKVEAVVRTDFVTFLTASKIVEGGEGKKLYNIDYQHEVQQKIIHGLYKTAGTLLFMNVPAVAVLYIPAGYLSPVLGYRMMGMLCILLFILVVHFLLVNGTKKLNQSSLPYLIAVSYFPFLAATFNTQIVPLLIFAALMGVYLCLYRKKYLLAGIFMGLVGIKFQYLSVAPFLFLISGDKKRFLVGFLLSSSLLMFVSFLVIGNSFLGYLNFLKNTDNVMYNVYPSAMLSTHSLFKQIPFIGEGWKSPLLLLDATLYLIVFLYFISKVVGKRISLRSAFSAALIFSVPMSVHVLSHDLIVFILPIFLLMEEYLLNRNRVLAILLAGFLVLLPWVSLINLNALFSIVLILFGILFLSKNRVIYD